MAPPLVAALLAAEALASSAAPAPAPTPAAFVFGDARFSFVSPALVRMQLRSAGGGDFDLRPSLSMALSAAPPRAPVDVAASFVGADTLVLATSALRLTYNRSAAAGGGGGGGGGGGFDAPGALGVELLSAPFSTWTPGASDAANLRGTRMDLGCYDTFDSCYSNGLGWGPLSRDGWAVWDDRSSVRLQASGAWWAGPTTLLEDLYMFAHGLDYAAALRDFAAVSGGAPLPPAAAFGVFWSTWYDFSETEFEVTVLDEYVQRGLPLSAVVFDMGWHKTDNNDSRCPDWGGFSWNTSLFPRESPGSSPSFVQFLQSDANPLGHGLAVLLNGHPDTGISPCEDNYTAFCDIVGVDAAARALLPCDMGNATWVGALQQTMLDPKLISWWWTDYGGCAPPSWPFTWPLTSSAGCKHAVQRNTSDQGLLWSNAVYGGFLQARGRRPLTLSRYGGIGNQRYGIGFSGDTQSTWETLRLQVAMTPTAANVLFGYWSHDLGGYNIFCPAANGSNAPCECGEVVQPCNLTTGKCGRSGPELYTRWLQFGALSPIFRPHCSHCDKRIWAYDIGDYSRMRAAMLLRQALRPYLYTAARAAVDSAVVALRPLYLDWPLLDEAYAFADTEYLLGPAMLAAPVTAAAQDGGGSNVTLWLPPGTWARLDGSASFAGPLTLTGLSFGIGDYPVFARGGAALPLRPPSEPEASTSIIWAVFSDEAGAGMLYEDDGVSLAYAAEGAAGGGNASAVTRLAHSLSAGGSLVSVTIAPRQGTYAGAPDSRRHIVQLRRAAPPPGGAGDATVTVNGVALAWSAPPNGEDYSSPAWWVVPASLASPWLPLGAVVIVLDTLPAALAIDVEVRFAAAAVGAAGAALQAAG